MADGAVVEAHDASEKIITADGDRRRDSAVGDITVVLAHDAASTATANNDGIVKGEVLHLSVDGTEKSLVIEVIVNTDTADGLVVAVEVAVERMVEVANGRIVVFIGGTRVVVSDVVHQLEELAAVVVAIVHVGGQRVPVGHCANSVRVGLGAATVPLCLGRLPEGHEGEEDENRGFLHF